MKLCFCNGKGGTGKTTLSILTALALHSAGKQVSLIDNDPQGTTKNWVSEFAPPDITLGTHGEVVIIDTPPRLDDERFLDSVRQADLNIVVSSPSPSDLWTTMDTVELLNKHQLKAVLLYNRVREITKLAQAREEMARKIGLPLIKESVKERTVYQTALLGGWSSLTPEARQEILTVAIALVTST